IQGQLFGRWSFGLLLTRRFRFRCRFALQRPPQHHHPPLLAPSAQPQHVLSPLPLLPRLHPFLFREDLSDQLLHIRALLEFEQVPKLSLLGSPHGFPRARILAGPAPAVRPGMPTVPVAHTTEPSDSPPAPPCPTPSGSEKA